MKKQLVFGAMLGAIVAVAAAETLTVQQTEALTTIDSLPTRTELETALGSGTPPNQLLLALATNGSDTGIRLRAISALPPYYDGSAGSNDPVHIALVAVITDNASQLAGADLVVLRAAIESLGTLKFPDDIGVLAPLLNHPSRDIRAAAARALGELCNTSAINDLRVRYQNESTDQVKLAISATLRILSQSNCQ
jgi:HEAT repeat protein